MHVHVLGDVPVARGGGIRRLPAEAVDLSQLDIHVSAVLLKMYLRDLPAGLFPSATVPLLTSVRGRIPRFWAPFRAIDPGGWGELGARFEADRPWAVLVPYGRLDRVYHGAGAARGRASTACGSAV